MKFVHFACVSFAQYCILPNEVEENYLTILSCSFKDSRESKADIVKLGPKLMNASLSSGLLSIDWKMLEGEVRLPCFHKVRSLDFDELSSFLSVYKVLVLRDHTKQQFFVQNLTHEC